MHAHLPKAKVPGATEHGRLAPYRVGPVFRGASSNYSNYGATVLRGACINLLSRQGAGRCARGIVCAHLQKAKVPGATEHGSLAPYRVSPIFRGAGTDRQVCTL